MAVTLDSYGTTQAGWIVNAYSADASGCEVIKAGGGAGTYHCIDRITIACIAAIDITIGAGETGGAVTAEMFGPFSFAATGGSPITMEFNPPLKMAANVALVVDASGAGKVCVVVQGHTI